MTWEVLRGDCLQVLPTLEAGSVDAVITSPPYAEQRKKFYGGIPEAEYPAWTVVWMNEVKRILKPQGSVLINIREHVKDGQISDYVHKTRLALRAAGWCECDELIWVKPSSPPVGHPRRPRRSWERILWFSPSSRPWCNPKANGTPSKHVGMAYAPNAAAWVQQMGRGFKEGIARSRDYVTIGACEADGGHPAAYPVPLAAWMMRLVTPPGGAVLDPFCGSGSTGAAALENGYEFIGIELNPEYIKLAEARLNSQPARLAV